MEHGPYINRPAPKEPERFIRIPLGPRLPDIHEEVNEVYRAKQWHDTYEDKQAERICGCGQCGNRYRHTLNWYVEPMRRP